MQYSQKNFMRIIGNEQRNNGQNFWEILERIIGKISSIIGTGLKRIQMCHKATCQNFTLHISTGVCEAKILSSMYKLSYCINSLHIYAIDIG